MSVLHKKDIPSEYLEQFGKIFNTQLKCAHSTQESQEFISKHLTLRKKSFAFALGSFDSVHGDYPTSCLIWQTMLDGVFYDESSRILEVFLRCDVDCSVQFEIDTRPRQKATEGTGSQDKRLPTISLLEAVKLHNPPNAETLKALLRRKSRWWRQVESAFTSGAQSHTPPTLEDMKNCHIHSVIFVLLVRLPFGALR